MRLTWVLRGFGRGIDGDYEICEEEEEKITTIVDESKVNLHDLFVQKLGEDRARTYDKKLLEAIKPQLEYPFTNHRVYNKWYKEAYWWLQEHEGLIYAVAGAVLGFLFVVAFIYFKEETNGK